MNITDARPSDNEGRDHRLLSLLQRVWTYAITTKSDRAREYADEIAQAASAGFLTTEVLPNTGVFGRLWKVTPLGLTYLWDKADAVATEEALKYLEDYTADEPANA